LKESFLLTTFFGAKFQYRNINHVIFQPAMKNFLMQIKYFSCN